MRLQILRVQATRHQKTGETERKRLEETHQPSFAIGLLFTLALGAAFGFLGYAALKSAVAAGGGGVLGAAAGVLAIRLFGLSAERGPAPAHARVCGAAGNIPTLKQENGHVEVR